jgi:hypothetical protein
MIQVIKIVIVMACAMAVIGCSNNESPGPKPADKSSQPAATGQQSNISLSAFEFLKALQVSDKKQLYKTSRLTADSVEESRMKLTNTKKYKLTAEQRTETEHALRISGNIDFYVKKITPLLKGADIKITDSTRTEQPKIPMIIHTVKIIYKNTNQTPTDTSGKQLKELAFRLQQIDRKVDGMELFEFVIDNNDFIDIMDRNYQTK